MGQIAAKATWQMRPWAWAVGRIARMLVETGCRAAEFRSADGEDGAGRAVAGEATDEEGDGSGKADDAAGTLDDPGPPRGDGVLSFGGAGGSHGFRGRRSGKRGGRTGSRGGGALRFVAPMAGKGLQLALHKLTFLQILQ